ncbi:MAG: alanine racemase [Oscillospiraceae bacterium]|nr:alanine racemase [Oscillospiraceae bacterium]
MELREKHCWAEIDIDAIKYNYNLIKETFDRPFYAVVKADAYGHGAKYLAKVYNEMDVFGFCVSQFSEAMELRNAGINKPILILGYTDPQKAYELFKNNLTQTVFSTEYATRLNNNALYPVDCHIKLDTGMGRLGFDLAGDKEQAHSEIRNLLNYRNLRFTGVFSHFSVADSTGEKELLHTQKQMDLFRETARLMDSWGFNLKVIHGQNSAGIARKLNGVYNTMRAGVILYGQQPSDEVIMPQIKPAMKLKTIVTHIKTIHRGQSVGYGMRFTAEKDTKVATIASGYADGIPRLLARTGHTVQINGRYYPIIGSVCMDQMMVDITDSEGISIGDEVVVIDGKGENSYDKVAEKTFTVNYEVMCDVSRRVPKVYIEEGKIKHIEYGM